MSEEWSMASSHGSALSTGDSPPARPQAAQLLREQLRVPYYFYFLDRGFAMELLAVRDKGDELLGASGVARVDTECYRWLLAHARSLKNKKKEAAAILHNCPICYTTGESTERFESHEDLIESHCWRPVRRVARHFVFCAVVRSFRKEWFTGKSPFRKHRPHWIALERPAKLFATPRARLKYATRHRS